MPVAHGFRLGLADGQTGFGVVPLPSIEHQVVVIDSISVIRGGGRLLTDGDQALVGLSHQVDILDSLFTDDEIDLLTDRGFDIWWTHGLSETDHVLDRLEFPESVAGPQGVVFHNGTGGTTSIRVDISYRTVRLANITQWALLKQRTSYESQV